MSIICVKRFGIFAILMCAFAWSLSAMNFKDGNISVTTASQGKLIVACWVKCNSSGFQYIDVVRDRDTGTLSVIAHEIAAGTSRTINPDPAIVEVLRHQLLAFEVQLGQR